MADNGNENLAHMRAQHIFSLEGRVALVTGAGGGLGRRFARVLAANGANVAVSDVDEISARAVAGEIGQEGGKAIGLGLDVTSEASLRAALQEIRARFGAVDLLINNAGVLATGRAMALAQAQWRRVMAVNLDGAWQVSQAVAQQMEGEDGIILNVASVLGLATGKGILPYTVAKAALVQMTRALALEWAPAGIRVNALAPGYFMTDINRDFTGSRSGAALKKRLPLRRFGQEDELDGPLLLLASKASTFMTGSVIVVDGGQLLTA